MGLMILSHDFNAGCCLAIDMGIHSMSQCLSWCTKCTVCIVYITINVAPTQVWIAVFLSCLFIRKCTVCIVYIIINVALPKFGLQCYFLICLLENVRFVLYIL